MSDNTLTVNPEIIPKVRRINLVRKDTRFKKLAELFDLTALGWRPEGIFKRFADEYGYKVTGAGDIIREDNASDSVEEDFKIYLSELDNEIDGLLIALSQNYDVQLSEIKRLFYKKTRTVDDQRVLLSRAAKKHREAKTAQIRDSIACIGEDLGPLTELVGYLTGIPPREEDVYAFAHSLWLVKRSLFNRPRAYHQMLILYGSQGIGKTFLFPKIFGPLQDFVMHNQDMTQINDSSALDSYTRYFVQIYDELQNAERTCINALKNVITADTLWTRMRFDTRKTLKTMKATFFGTTNKPLETLINDSTGMRRFYSLHVSDNYKNYWDKVNKLDFEALLRGIDENREWGYMTGEIGEKIAKVKENYMRPNTIIQFLEDKGVIDISSMEEPPELRKVSPAAILGAFQDYLHKNGLGDEYNLSRRMNHIGPLLKERGYSNPVKDGERNWWLPVDCLL